MSTVICFVRIDVVVKDAIIVAIVSSQKQTDCNDGNSASSEDDDGCKEGISEARLAYGLMIDAILATVLTGKEIPASDGGMLRSPHLQKRSGGVCPELGAIAAVVHELNEGIKNSGQSIL